MPDRQKVLGWLLVKRNLFKKTLSATWKQAEEVCDEDTEQTMMKVYLLCIQLFC